MAEQLVGGGLVHPVDFAQRDASPDHDVFVEPVAE
jgi:hypothetical protein